MSKIIASAAIRGAHELVRQADEFFVKGHSRPDGSKLFGRDEEQVSRPTAQ